MAKKPYGVLLLHGLTSSLDCINGIEPPLRKLGIPLRMPVLRGHGGESYKALIGVKWRDWLADGLEAFLDLRKEAEKIIVFGHSMGSMVAITLAIEHAASVDSLVLAAATMQMRNPMAPYRPLYFLAPLARFVMPIYEMPPRFDDPKRASFDTTYHRAPIDAVNEFLDFITVTRPRLLEVTVPTLILQSRNDRTVHPDSAHVVYQGISTPPDRKRIAWFERTGHEMFLDSERDATIQTVVDFVRERTKNILGKKIAKKTAPAARAGSARKNKTGRNAKPAVRSKKPLAKRTEKPAARAKKAAPKRKTR